MRGITPEPPGSRKNQAFLPFLRIARARHLCQKALTSRTSPFSGPHLQGGDWMTVRSFGGSLAAMVLVSTLSVGCSSSAEKSANRAEDAAKRAEAAASRVEAAAQRAEAAAEKAERLFSKH